MALLGVTGCGPVDADGRALRQYEQPATRALVLEILQRLPDLNPGVPKSHALTLGEILRGRDFTAASVPFMQELAKLSGRRFVSPEVLTTSAPSNHAIDPDTRVPVYVLQIRSMKPIGAESWEYEAAWSYKERFERRRWRVSGKAPEAWHIEPLEVLEAK
jgi:hypothetical protein